jgi:hypothetical protein
MSGPTWLHRFLTANPASKSTEFATAELQCHHEAQLFIGKKGQGFGLVVRAAGWHAGDPGSIRGRDSLYTFGCMSQCFESALAEILRYIKPLIYLFILKEYTFKHL